MMMTPHFGCLIYVRPVYSFVPKIPTAELDHCPKNPSSMNKDQSDKLGRDGENLVKLLLERLGARYTPAAEKTPSIDGQIQIYDEGSSGYLYVNAQVKTGHSYLRRRVRDKLYIKVEPPDVRKWLLSNTPVVLIWVDPVSDDWRDWRAYWGDARLGKPNAGQFAIRDWSVLDDGSLQRLRELARIGAGRPSIAPLRGPLLPVADLPDVRRQALEAYRDWCLTGAWSPKFGPIEIKLKAWRHITRTGQSRHALLHRLSLLPLARYVLQTASRSYFLRALPDHRGRWELHAVRGLYRPQYRADMLVEVVIKVQRKGNRMVNAELYSLHERRGWYG
jgi:hypothetical protein